MSEIPNRNNLKKLEEGIDEWQQGYIANADLEKIKERFVQQGTWSLEESEVTDESESGWVRESIDLPESSIRTLVDLANANNITSGEELRDVIAFSRWFHQFMDSGGKIYIQDKNGTKEVKRRKRSSQE